MTWSLGIGFSNDSISLPLVPFHAFKGEVLWIAFLNLRRVTERESWKSSIAVSLPDVCNYLSQARAKTQIWELLQVSYETIGAQALGPPSAPLPLHISRDLD